jgi:hypothetical protein
MKSVQVVGKVPANDTDAIRCDEVARLKLTRLPRGQARPSFVLKGPDRLWSGYQAASATSEA